MVDLKKMNRAELEELRVSIDDRLVELEQEQRLAAVEEMRALAEKHGVSLEEMVKLASQSASPSGAFPKFRDPGNPTNTWTGRGRKPKWLVTALDNGADLQEFAV